MLCSICHKNEAVLCYTEIVNGVKNEQYLCQECAGKYTGFGKDKFSAPGSDFISGLLAGFLGSGQPGLDEKDIQKTNIVCPACRMTYNEFLKYGKFGCQDCYKTFGLILDPYLKKIHGGCIHLGKRPKHQEETVCIPEIGSKKETERGADASEKQAPIASKTAETHSGESHEKTEKTPATELEKLQLELKEAVAKEAYETAAKLRDKIRAMKKEGGAVHDEEVV